MKFPDALSCDAAQRCISTGTLLDASNNPALKRSCGVVTLIVLSQLVSACAIFAREPVASDATVATHVARATAAAAQDMQPLLSLCKPAPSLRPTQAEGDERTRSMIARPAPQPGAAFDNLFYIGGDWASAWLLKTADGLILIDALNNEVEAAALIEGGMRKLGLNPAEIKFIVITHGHGDHYGGASYLASKYGARLVMSQIDWTMTATQLEFTTPVWGAAPKRGARDLAVGDGDSIVLGGTKVDFYLTPGHTMGTISPVFDVVYQGKQFKAALWGGTAFNFGNNIPRMNSYIDATARMRDVAASRQISVLLSNHPSYDGTISKLNSLRPPAAKPTSNPFVVGVSGVERGLTAMNECAQAQRDRYVQETAQVASNSAK